MHKEKICIEKWRFLYVKFECLLGNLVFLLVINCKQNSVIFPNPDLTEISPLALEDKSLNENKKELINCK